MPGMYNLRSSKGKKNISTTNCYLEQYLKNSSPEEFNPRVCLERLKLLDCSNENSRFYLDKNRILVRENKPRKSSKSQFWKFFCSIILIALCILCFKGEVQPYGVSIARRFQLIHPVIRNHFFESVKVYRNHIKSFMYKEKDVRNAKKYTVQKKYSNLKPRQDEVDVMKIVEEEFMDFARKNKFRNLTNFSKSFIKEQCEVDVKNNMQAVFEESNITDYALESQGAEIVNVFDTEPYGTKSVKFLNFHVWPVLGDFLMNSFKYSNANDANSVLKPWKKAGDCWAFKGSQGRVEIKLSEEIFITAITIDHIPKEFTLDGNIESAPRRFSVMGILEPGMQTSRLNLCTFEYKIMGPSSQTFLVHPKPMVPLRRVEVKIQSNHGHVNYTCIYKIRVHGHK